MTIKSLIQENLPPTVTKAMAAVYLHAYGVRRGLSLRWGGARIDVIKANAVVRLSPDHYRYAIDVIENFDFYFGAVEHRSESDLCVVDYSRAERKHAVGFDLHEVIFPGLAEPLAATLQYMDFASLAAGETVLDLGAYSGLTSILFQEAVGPSGKVVAVDADPRNIACIEENFAAYEDLRHIAIPLVRGAVWEHDEGIAFSSEGNMGASAAAIVGNRRGHVERVPSLTLSTLAAQQGLERVDFIKCDIEGAESVVFKDAGFFERFQPRMIIEAHLLGRTTTVGVCTEQLSRYGYGCRVVAQVGSSLPLLECVPHRAAA